MTRTHDLLITNQLLYRLSYISIFTFGVADLILTNQLLYRLSYISIFTFGVADLILTNQLLYVSIGNDEIISAENMIPYFCWSVNLFSQENELFLLLNRDNTNCILWIFRGF